MSDWIVRLAPTFEEWLGALSARAQEAVVAGIEVLEESGPWIDLPPVGGAGGLPECWSMSLLDGRLVIGYRWDPAGDEILLTYGHSVDDAVSTQIQLVNAFGAADQAGWDVTDESRLQ